MASVAPVLTALVVAGLVAVAGVSAAPGGPGGAGRPPHRPRGGFSFGVGVGVGAGHRCTLGGHGRFEDACPRCRRRLSRRGGRPWCPDCFLVYRFAVCRSCHRFLLVGASPLDVEDLGPTPRAAPAAARSERQLYLRWMDLGLAQLRAGRAGEAGEAFRSALREEPDDPVALFHWALALAAGGEGFRAGSLMQDALRRYPGLTRMRLDMAAMFGGAAAFERVLAQLPRRGGRPEERFALACLLHLAGRAAEVREVAAGLGGALPEALLLGVATP